MTRALLVHRGGAHLTVQDKGRPGYLAYGLSRGGAADRIALCEGAALLGQSPDAAVIEMAGAGGVFEAQGDLRFALTGAPMSASIDGKPVEWNACHLLPSGARLTIGGGHEGVFGYLHLGGGIAAPLVLGSRSVHTTAGIGQAIANGDRIEIGPDTSSDRTSYRLPHAARFAGGMVRVVPSLQTRHFSPAELARFEATAFVRDPRGNRMGVRLVQDGPGFFPGGGLAVLSEPILPGDVQITGDGHPFVLLTDCQTTGGYPRIATVIPPDLPIAAQAGVGTGLQFRFIDVDKASEIARDHRTRMQGLPARRERRVTRPEDVPDLLTQQLISGVTRGDEL